MPGTVKFVVGAAVAAVVGYLAIRWLRARVGDCAGCGEAGRAVDDAAPGTPLSGPATLASVVASC